MALPPASGPALQVWEAGEEILVRLMDGRIQRTRSNLHEWRVPEQPFPLEINHVVSCSNIAILSWIGRDERFSFLASLDLDNEWKSQYVNRTEFVNELKIDKRITHQFHWMHELTAEILALASNGKQFAFATYNQGVYMMKTEMEWCEEIWRKEIPNWPKPWADAIWKSPENENGNVETVVQSIHLDETLLTLFDERGSWVKLSAETGQEIAEGRLPFNGLNTGTWKGTGGWAIAEDDRKLHFLDENFSIISTHSVPGPVNHAAYSKEGWFWTGWRHDGSESRINATNEIGLYVRLNDNVQILSNDGKWHHFEK